jgi:DNA modification methylase
VGNTTLAAIEAGRSSFGFEVEPGYVALARRRLRQKFLDAEIHFHEPQP